MSEPLTMGGVPLERMHAALARAGSATRAFWAYDLDTFTARAARLMRAMAPLEAQCAYALKANALPALLACAAAAGLAADAGSLGELEAAREAGFPADRRYLSGNGRTPEEAAWIAREGAAFVSADALEELELLEAEARRASAVLRVALRVNPGIPARTHPHIATGDYDAKFGITAEEAVTAFAGRSHWTSLSLEGLHVHVGSQILDVETPLAAARAALAIVGEATRCGATPGFIDVGGGFGIDYAGDGGEFPLEAFGRALAALPGARDVHWIVEPGRWLVAPVGVLVAEVLRVKQRNGRRIVVVAAGMNDLLRPALYGVTHRIVAVAPRPGPREPADVVGPVCESADTFARDWPLPPLEVGDLVAILDAGAYGAAMSSAYNGRPRLAELVVADGRVRVDRSEQPFQPFVGRADRPLEL